MVLVITAQGFMDMDTMGMALDTTDIIITMGGDQDGTIQRYG